MIFARSVLDVHIIFGQLFQPPDKLPLWMSKFVQPYQTVVVSADSELLPQQIVAEVMAKSEER